MAKINVTPLDVKKYLKLLKPIAKHHYFVLAVVLLGSLVVVIYMVNQTLLTPTDSTYYDERSASGVRAQFDKATIDKIEALQRSSEAPTNTPPAPSGTRTNPFAE